MIRPRTALDELRDQLEREKTRVEKGRATERLHVLATIRPDEIALVERIIEECARDAKLSLEIVNKGRTQRIACVRQMAMYLARNMTHLSFPQLGDCFDRDHSTVMYAHEQIVNRQIDSPAFARTLLRIAAAAKAPAQEAAA